MKHIDEYRDGALARKFASSIAQAAIPETQYRFMEFCGGHTHAISRYGITDLLPGNVQMIHGPGCPVCVLPISRIDTAIRLAQNPDVTLCTYGDLMRVPGSRNNSLLKAKANGADIRMVYSTLDALRIAREEPGRQIVFFAIGFETTTPPTALAIQQAIQQNLDNFSVFCNHVLTPSAIQAILDPSQDPVQIDGFIGPAHVSTVIGSQPYERFATDYHKPVVITGFEPLDVMQAILMLIEQINQTRCEVENQYIRAVTRYGNQKAQALCNEFLDPRASFEWRGLGEIPHSGLKLKPAYAHYDAELRFNLQDQTGHDNPACECPAILRGAKTPAQCKLFGTACTPETPLGSCMVSSEGACAAHWTYGRFRDVVRQG